MRACPDAEPGQALFGTLNACPKCNEITLYRQSGIFPNERKISLDYIDTDERPGTATMIKAARDFMRTGKGWLSICGPFGNAKSTTLKAIVIEYLKCGVSAKYITLTELMDYVYEAYDNEKSGERDLGRIRRLMAYQILCIDELDKYEMDRENARRVQNYFFDTRYRMAETTGTVFAWNGTLKTLTLPAVADRMTEFMIVENRDPSYRAILGKLAMEEV